MTIMDRFVPDKISRWQLMKMHLKVPLYIPRLFKKYDAPQATRMSMRMLYSSAEGLLSPTGVTLVRRLALTTWYLLGPILILAGGYVAHRAAELSYAVMWKAFALMLAGFTLSMHALGQLTLTENARSVFRPLAVVPGRIILLVVLWIPMWVELPRDAALIFAAFAIALYLLAGPIFTHWLQLFAFHTGSPRRASITEAMAMPVSNEDTLLRLAAHEAGHALLYGLGDEIPEDLYLYVDEKSMDALGGAVLVAEEVTIDRATVDQLRFRLLMLAGGAAGEQVRCGSMSLGSHYDFVNFEALAIPYMLAAGCAVIAEPKAQAEFALNAAAIAQLRTEMIAMAQHVIEENLTVHSELVDRLLGQRELAYDDVLPILAKVRRIEKAAVPTWPARMVTHRLRPITGQLS